MDNKKRSLAQTTVLQVTGTQVRYQ